MVLPMMLVVFAIIIEGSRAFWGYQAAITGVRDATRYLSRTASREICTSGGGAFDAATVASVEAKVSQSATGDNFLPALVSVNSVTSTPDCTVVDAPIGTVSAELTIELPFGGLFALFGDAQGDIVTVVVDRARIYGT